MQLRISQRTWQKRNKLPADPWKATNKGESYGPHTFDRIGASSRGFRTGMAVQPKLGVLPQWNSGHDSLDSSGLGFARGNSRTILAE
jgi:hypothetical protein